MRQIDCKLCECFQGHGLEWIQEYRINLVKQIAAALARKNGQEESVVTSQLFGRLSLNLMRGNALMLSSRFQADCPPHVDGIL